MTLHRLHPPTEAEARQARVDAAEPPGDEYGQKGRKMSNTPAEGDWIGGMYEASVKFSDWPPGCTCHLDDNPPRPCPGVHAFSECCRAWFESTYAALGRVGLDRVEDIVAGRLAPEAVIANYRIARGKL